MMQPRVSGRPVTSLHAVRGKPRPMVLPPPERRNLARRAALVQRLAAEFHELPGLILSVPQASRLLGVDEAAGERILAALARDGMLRRRASGSYGRALI